MGMGFYKPSRIPRQHIFLAMFMSQQNHKLLLRPLHFGAVSVHYIYVSHIIVPRNLLASFLIVASSRCFICLCFLEADAAMRRSVLIFISLLFFSFANVFQKQELAPQS
jgi:hypothetical protein